MSDFLNEYPYANYHNLNLDWIIKITKAVEAETARLSEEFAQIEIMSKDYIQTMIDTAIASNNIDIYRRINDLKAEMNANMEQCKTDITNAYTAYVNQQINLLKIYVDSQDASFDNLARSYADTALTMANQYTDEHILDYNMMINPITGEYEDVREVVDDIVKYFHSENTLTAAEYDALNLTAEGYDAYDLTAYDYDFNSKTLLV